MKKFLVILPALCVLCFSASAQRHILIEAEQFDNYGGWSLDQQFMEQMGSSYLLAHGAGVPVAAAVTTAELPKSGRYHVYVRTYNWTAPFAEGPGPGAFMLKVGGREFGPLGQSGNAWELCSDRYGPYTDEPATNPQGPSAGSYCVVRGGGIFGGTNSCRVSYRSFDAPQSNLIINGFRIVMTD